MLSKKKIKEKNKGEVSAIYKGNTGGNKTSFVRKPSLMTTSSAPPSALRTVVSQCKCLSCTTSKRIIRKSEHF